MMSKIWSITAPAWYIEDQIELRMKDAVGPDWTTKPVTVHSLSFRNANKERYKMSHYVTHPEKMDGGTL